MRISAVVGPGLGIEITHPLPGADRIVLTGTPWAVFSFADSITSLVHDQEWNLIRSRVSVSGGSGEVSTHEEEPTVTVEVDMAGDSGLRFSRQLGTSETGQTAVTIAGSERQLLAFAQMLSSASNACGKNSIVTDIEAGGPVAA